MSLVKVFCNKCGESTKLDTCGKSRKEVEKWLQSNDGGFHCFGNHVELGARSDYWTIDWDSEEEGQAPSEKEFYDNLRVEKDEVYDTEELKDRFEVLGFSYGFCSARNKKTGTEYTFCYTTSPKGKRYYFI